MRRRAGRARLPRLHVRRRRAAGHRAPARRRHHRRDGRRHLRARLHGAQAGVQGAHGRQALPRRRRRATPTRPAAPSTPPSTGTRATTTGSPSSRAAGRASPTTTRSRRSAAASLLDVQLETGRTHQIRVHLSAMRHPLRRRPHLRRRPDARQAARAARGSGCTPARWASRTRPTAAGWSSPARTPPTWTARWISCVTSAPDRPRHRVPAGVGHWTVGWCRGAERDRAGQAGSWWRALSSRCSSPGTRARSSRPARRPRRPGRCGSARSRGRTSPAYLARLPAELPRARGGGARPRAVRRRADRAGGGRRRRRCGAGHGGVPGAAPPRADRAAVRAPRAKVCRCRPRSTPRGSEPQQAAAADTPAAGGPAAGVAAAEAGRARRPGRAVRARAGRPGGPGRARRAGRAGRSAAVQAAPPGVTAPRAGARPAAARSRPSAPTRCPTTGPSRDRAVPRPAGGGIPPDGLVEILMSVSALGWHGMPMTRPGGPGGRPREGRGRGRRSSRRSVIVALLPLGFLHVTEQRARSIRSRP